MRVNSCSRSSILLGQIVLLTTTLLIEITSSTESKAGVQESSLESSQSRYKRAPGWGKRKSISDELFDDLENSQEFPREADYKRAPGWGKRSSKLDLESAVLSDKRAPGWGKRNLEMALTDASLVQDSDLDKRAPGWGKRAPGWGKRAPGWGKRAPGWGKRSVDGNCQLLDEKLDEYIRKAIEVRGQLEAECGSILASNEPIGK